MKKPPISATKKSFSACYGGAWSREPDKNADYVLASDSPKEMSANELKNSSWQFVPFLDARNKLLKQIFNAATTSPTNAAILRQKARMVCGDGLAVEAKKSMLASRRNGVKADITEEQELSLNEYLEQFSYDGDVYDQLEKVVIDFLHYANAWVLIKKTTVNVDGVSTKKYYQTHIPFKNGRLKKRDEGEADSTHVGVSELWEDVFWGGKPPDLKLYPLYPKFERSEDGKTEWSVLHIKDHSIATSYYPIPTYIAGVLSIEMEYRIPKFNQSQFDNGFMPSAVMRFFGDFTPEESKQRDIEFRAKMTGTGTNSKVITQYLNDEREKMEAQILSQLYEGHFKELSTLSRENIVTAHEWSMALAGMATGGTLGNNQQIRTEVEVRQNLVITPIQNKILKQWLNKTLPEAAEFEDRDFGNTQLIILNLVPVSFMGDLDVKGVLTEDEQRQELGFEPLNLNNITIA